MSQSWHIFAHGVMRLCPRCYFMQISLPGVTPAPDMKWCQGSAQGLGFCSRDGVTSWMLSAVATIASGKLKIERIRKIRQTTCCSSSVDRAFLILANRRLRNRRFNLRVPALMSEGQISDQMACLKSFWCFLMKNLRQTTPMPGCQADSQ